MTFRDAVLKKLRRRCKALKKDHEAKAVVQSCIQDLEACIPTESKDSVLQVIQRHGLTDLLGGFHG